MSSLPLALDADLAVLDPERSADLSSAPDIALVLSEQIGSGHDRVVWRHPLNRALGIKVSKPDQERDQNLIELHYGMHLQRLGIASRHLPRVYGWVQTDHGPGLVVDLVQQADGTPCPTLPHALRSGMVSEMEAAGMVGEACEWLADNGVILADPGINNVVVHRSPETGRPYLAFVDGLGTRNFDFKYRLRCALPALERWTARHKADVCRGKFLRMLRDRSSRMWVPKKTAAALA
ncbi:hypothetical protein CAL12_23600 [Bordetella genomosp. 8]|uniref:PhoP regulatory network protein YrbL n=1 Tax=Bordetella genomosp. 8 TaxID=1416806 RepID=A0A1W6YSC9_9BORD|nr:YrbL family protein [Bordetella genomosp. 8]ARP83513.1 hypothetical protein CAL12_23600 [Bordetella genomosp. 8]